MTASIHLKKLVELLKSLPMKPELASFPAVAALDQLLNVPYVWCILGLLIWCAHLERTQDKRDEQAEKERRHQRDLLDYEAAEAEKRRTFQDHLIDKLLAHTPETDLLVDSTSTGERLRVRRAGVTGRVRSKRSKPKKEAPPPNSALQERRGTKRSGTGTTAVTKA